MKLSQLFESGSVFASMLLRLVKAGEPVYVNAKGRTFLTGNERNGYQAMRSPKEGWVIQHNDTGVTKLDAGASVARVLESDVLHVSTYKDYALFGKGSISSSLFQLERPVDDHYTIKKVDGVWTILDREPVTEEEQLGTDEFMIKMASRLADKRGMKHEVSENDALIFKTAVFTIQLMYKPKGDSPWVVGWFKNGSRVGNLGYFDSVNKALTSIEP